MPIDELKFEGERFNKAQKTLFEIKKAMDEIVKKHSGKLWNAIPPDISPSIWLKNKRFENSLMDFQKEINNELKERILNGIYEPLRVFGFSYSRLLSYLHLQ